MGIRSEEQHLHDTRNRSLAERMQAILDDGDRQALGLPSAAMSMLTRYGVTGDAQWVLAMYVLWAVHSVQLIEPFRTCLLHEAMRTNDRELFRLLGEEWPKPGEWPAGVARLNQAERAAKVAAAELVTRLALQEEHTGGGNGDE